MNRTHFDCIGVSSSDFVLEAYADAVPVYADVGDRFQGAFRDASGAAVAVVGGDQGLECATPFFAPADGGTVWRVRNGSRVIDPGCDHCGGAYISILNSSRQELTRAVVQWSMFPPYRDWLLGERTFNLRVAAFVESARFFETAEEFARRSHDAKPLATDFFIPVGMWEDRAEASVTKRAKACFGGRTVASQRLRNQRTGGEFARLRIESMTGPIDAVMSLAEGEALPKVGSFSFICAWLVGSPHPSPSNSQRRGP
jgi:hypothetical protein